LKRANRSGVLASDKPLATAAASLIEEETNERPTLNKVFCQFKKN
jgi:hypothetical protein